MLLVLPRALPDRKDQQKFGSMREFTLEVAVAFDGPLVGKSVGEAGLRELERLYLVEIERDGSVVTAVPSEERLRGGDRLVFAGDTQAISDLLPLAFRKLAKDKVGVRRPARQPWQTFQQ